MAIGRHQNVIRLEIAVHHVTLLHALETAHNVLDNHAYIGDRHATAWELLYVATEIASQQVKHQAQMATEVELVSQLSKRLVG